MDFAFDDDQLGLQAAATEVLAKECSAAYLRSVTDEGHDPADLWATLAALDWPGLAVPEADGGVGGTFLDLAIVLEQLGAAGDPTPLLATASQFVPLVLAAGTAEQRHRFLAPVVREGRPATVVASGDDGCWDLDAPPVQARRNDGGGVQEGRGRFVLDADRADQLAVVAGTEDGPTAFVVPASTASIIRVQAFDPTLHLTDVVLDGVPVDDDRRLAGPGGPGPLVTGRDHAVTAMALTTVGACQRALDLAVAYAGEREQFGVPIGSFQAIKHKAVDMHLAVERARALAYFAALAATEGDPRRSLAASMAKAAAGDAQRLVFRQAVQVFGGIGFTWENDLHRYLRRAKAGELLLGGAAHHRLQVADLVLRDPRRPSEVLTRCS